jgi:hypothetical protein
MYTILDIEDSGVARETLKPPEEKGIMGTALITCNNPAFRNALSVAVNRSSCQGY